MEQFRDLRQNPMSAFVLGAVLVFFVLTGLYKGWSLPLAVILVVPMCVLSALAGVALLGVARKNAILIVEFPRDWQLEGASIYDAA